MEKEELQRKRFQHAVNQAEKLTDTLIDSVSEFIANTHTEKYPTVSKLIGELTVADHLQIATSLALLVEREARKRVVFVPSPPPNGKANGS